MDGYRHGIQGPLLDYTMKKFKGHRCIDGGSSHAIKVQFETSREESGSSRKAMNCFHGISFFTALLCACLILVFCCYLMHFLHCCSWLNYNLQERQSTVLTWVLLTAHHLLRFMVIFRLFWAALGKLMSTEVFSRLNTTVDKEKTGNFRWRIPVEVAAFRVKTRPTVARRESKKSPTSSPAPEKSPDSHLFFIPEGVFLGIFPRGSCSPSPNETVTYERILAIIPYALLRIRKGAVSIRRSFNIPFWNHDVK